jgi:hypothetical protein
MEALQRLHNRGSISTDTGYNIDNSCKFESDGTNFLNRDVSSSSNRQTWTYSTWLKATELGVHNYFFDAYKNSNTFFILGISNAGRLVFYDIIAGTDYGRQTTALLRDPNAWYHVVFVSDTTNGTAADRYRLYLNGTRVTDFSTSYGDPGQNYNGSVNDAISHKVGQRTDIGTYFNGYLSETHLVDGTALEPTAFGEFDEDSGIWKPKEVDVTHGTNGFYLDYADAGDLGDDESGNGNDYSENNIDAANQATDTPTNNFATINSLAGLGMGATPFKFPQGGTEIKRDPDDSGGWVCVVSTMAVNKGKWYAEFEVLESPSITMYGYTTVAYYEGGSGLNYPQFYLGTTTASTGYYSNGNGANDAIYDSNSYPSAGVQSSAGTVISVALDCDNNKIHFANNGTYTNSSNPVNNTNGFPVIDDYVYFAHASNAGNKIYKTNLGGYTSDAISSPASDANGYGTFEYAPPSGYYALCTKNLEEFG